MEDYVKMGGMSCQNILYSSKKVKALFGSSSQETSDVTKD